MSARIIRVLLDVNMANQHDGLTELAREKKINVKELKAGELVIFINTEKTKLKVYGANDVIAYFRSPKGRIEMRMIQHIPEAFAAGAIDFTKALRATLEDIFRKKGMA